MRFQELLNSILSPVGQACQLRDAVVLAAPRIGLVATAGLSLLGSTDSRSTICLSVLTPTIFPNTGAVIETASLVDSIVAPFGTLPVYEHTPPQPYSIFDDDTIRVPFSMVTVGGLAFPVRVKFIGPYLSEPDPTTDTAEADSPTLPAL